MTSWFRRRLPDLNFPIKLDLGCGQLTPDGWVGLDYQDYGQNVVWDVRGGLPFPDNSVSDIRGSDFFEHISREDLTQLMLEILRVGQVGAILGIISPHSETIEAYYPNHYSLWDERSVRGLVGGLKGEPKHFEILSLVREGRNILVDLKITND